MQTAPYQLPEYQKPVLLKKSTRSTANLVEIGSERNVSPESIPPDRSPEFVEFIEREIDRKEYKDWARAAYDNFGQFSAQKAASLTKSECKQRKIFLGKVKQFWIEGFLQPSLQSIDAIKLEFKPSPDAIADLTQGIEALSLTYSRR